MFQLILSDAFFESLQTLFFSRLLEILYNTSKLFESIITDNIRQTDLDSKHTTGLLPGKTNLATVQQFPSSLIQTGYQVNVISTNICRAFHSTYHELVLKIFPIMVSVEIIYHGFSLISITVKFVFYLKQFRYLLVFRRFQILVKYFYQPHNYLIQLHKEVLLRRYN